MKNKLLTGKRNKIFGIGKRVVAVTGALLMSSAAIFCGATTLPSQAAKPSNGGDEVKYGNSMTLIEWKRLDDLPASDFWGMFMWESGGYWYHSAYSTIFNQDWEGVLNTCDPYISTGASFLTRTYLGCPYFKYSGTDGDNNNNKKFKIRFGSTKDKEDTGKWLYLDYNTLQVKGGGDAFTIRRHSRTEKSNNKTITYYTYDWFYNRSGWYDTRLELKDARIQGNTDDRHYDYFRIYQATEKKFSAIADYTVQSGQTQKISSDCFLLDGKTLKVQDNAVLNIEGNFLYNGKIECEGTIIVHPGATMTPFSPTLAAGNITLKNGGTIIIMPTGRVLAGLRSYTLGSTANGTVVIENGNIINYGLFAANRIELGALGTFENHSGGRAFFGYGIKSGIGSFYNDFNYKTSAGSLGLTDYDSYFKIKSGATFKAFDGSGFTYKGKTGDGLIYYSYDSDGKESISTL
jgi:hypothetical protein